MTRRTLTPLCAVNCLVVLATGCGRSGARLCPATGTVTYQGKAVEGAAVGFRSEETRSIATGMTDSQGRFKLSTYPVGEGVRPGKYKATVSKFTSPPGTGGGPVSMDEAVKMAKAARPAAKGPENQLPAKYADPTTSSLEYTVSPSGPNDFKIDLSN